MKDLVRKLRNLIRHIGAKTLIIAVTVLLLTAGIAVYTGGRLSATEKEVLLHQGELNAKEAATEYNRCLLTRVNIVTLVGKTVDNMLLSGSDNEAIRTYITKQTDNIIATLDPSTTGLYGWIGREYLDGVGWVPDADYVPTERPWYIQTMTSDREITFIEPYLDLQTNTVMMTVTDLMSDGESVLAMDVTLEPIQAIVEEVSAAIEGSYAFVMDETGVVVAHSDENQLGLNYLTDADTLGGAVAGKILLEGRMQFDLTAPEGNYSVYADRLEGGWYSVSMINADIWYRPLTRATVLFCVVLALVVSFLVFVFIRMSAKNLALQRLNMRVHLEESRGKAWKVLSETDRMTGLSERVSGERMVNELLKSGHSGMFIEVDIDRFKAINDTYGHQTGDLVITALADALRTAFRSNDIIMRLGGDEFCVYAVGIVSREMGESTVNRLFDKIRRLHVPGLPDGSITVSAGAVIHTEDKSASFTALYTCADSAMYASKKIPGNSLTFSQL